jgi:PH domain
MSGSKNESEDTSCRISSLCGYLWKMKRSHHRMILVPQWNKRWFSIEGRLLKWYAAASSDHSSGMVDLRFITNVAAFEAQGVYSFILSYPDRNILLRAANSSDMDKWIRALQFQADVARGGCGMTIVTASNTSGSNPQGKGRALKEKYRPPTLEANLEATMVRLQILESSVMKTRGRGIDSGKSAESEDSNLVDEKKNVENHKEKIKKRPPKENATRNVDDKGYSPTNMGTRGQGYGHGYGQFNNSAECADQTGNRISGDKSKGSRSYYRNIGDEDGEEDEERGLDKAEAKSLYSGNSERKCADSSDMRSETDSKESSARRPTRHNSDELRADDIRERRRDDSNGREISRGRESKTLLDPEDLEEIMPAPRSRSHHRSKAASDKKKDRGERQEESNLVSSSSSSSRSAGSRSAGRGGRGLPPPVKQGNWGYGEEDNYKDISDFEGGVSRRQYYALSAAAGRVAGDRERGGEKGCRGSDLGGGSSRGSRMNSVEDAMCDYDDLPEVDLQVRKPNQRAVRETNRQLERDRTVRRDSIPRSPLYAADDRDRERERERERERSSDRICGSQEETECGPSGNGWM